MNQLREITQNEIEKMVNDGKIIFWSNKEYRVIKDSLGQFLIKHSSGDCVGLKSEFVYDNTSNHFIEE